MSNFEPEAMCVYFLHLTWELSTPLEGEITAPSPSMIAAPMPVYAYFDPGISDITVHRKGDVNDVHEQMHPTRGMERVHDGPRRVRVDQESQDPDQQGPDQRPLKRTKQETDEDFVPLSSPQMPVTPIPAPLLHIRLTHT